MTKRKNKTRPHDIPLHKVEMNKKRPAQERKESQCKKKTVQCSVTNSAGLL